jgi:hypothetical protein
MSASLTLYGYVALRSPQQSPPGRKLLHLDQIGWTQIRRRWPIPARGFFRTPFSASLRKSERVNLHSMRTEPAPAPRPITSGFSSAAVANSYSTTEHCLLSHRTPIATKVECCTFPDSSFSRVRVQLYFTGAALAAVAVSPAVFCQLTLVSRQIGAASSTLAISA